MSFMTILFFDGILKYQQEYYNNYKNCTNYINYYYINLYTNTIYNKLVNIIYKYKY